MRVTTCAGYAARARPPPFMRDMCLRTTLISWIEASDRSIARVTSRLVDRVIPWAGAQSLRQHRHVDADGSDDERALHAVAEVRESCPRHLWSGLSDRDDEDAFGPDVHQRRANAPRKVELRERSR